MMFTSEPNGLSATGVQFFQAASRQKALELELMGMKRRGQSAYSICKQVYGFRGSRQRVAVLMEKLTEALIAEKWGNATTDQLVFLGIAMGHARANDIPPEPVCSIHVPEDRS
jgi:hypothetical protein